MSRLVFSKALIGLIALAAPTVPALAQTVPAAISVTGEGSVSVPPDLASVEGGVTTEAKSAKEASEINNAAMGKVLLALKAVGVDDADLQTSRLSLQPQYANQNRPGPNVVIGYRAANRITVRLRDVAKVAGVIDTLVSSGANEIGGIDFSVAATSKLLDGARDQAFADAKRKAEIYARAAGVALGAPLSIAEESAPGAMPVRKMMLDRAASAPVAQGEETLRVSVSVSFAIKPPTP